MRETLIEYLTSQKGYRVDDNHMRRPDDSIVAKLQNGRWVTNPTPQEMVEFNLYSGRGFPSMLCYMDLTNPGHK